MKLFNKVLMFLLILCVALVFSACGNNEADEFAPSQSFEYHFYPEEYEEEYSELNDSFTLEADTDYQIQVSADCESGTIEIEISYMDTDDEMYIVNSSAPCNDTISIPANTTDAISFAITIEPDTKGAVVVEVLSR